MTLPDRPLPRETLDGLTPPTADFPYFAFADVVPFEASPRGSVRTPAGDFDDPNAWFLADASLLAYGDADFVADRVRESPLPGLGWRARTLGPEGGPPRAVALDGPDALIVAFRGTSLPVPPVPENLSPAQVARLVDWILGNEDLKIDARLFPASREAGGRVHGGFLQAFQAISDQLDAAAASRRPDQALWLTGHSLGGALALLAASHLRESNVTGVYTYGCPRVGDAEFVATLPSCVNRRFVHRDDLIPNTPPSWPLGYRHAGEEQEVPDAAPRRPLQEWNDGFQALAAAVRLSLEQRRLAVGEAPLLVRGLADHAPVYYATLLWNALAAARRKS